jgi:hypothetical protein
MGGMASSKAFTTEGTESTEVFTEQTDQFQKVLNTKDTKVHEGNPVLFSRREVGFGDAVVPGELVFV